MGPRRRSSVGLGLLLALGCADRCGSSGPAELGSSSSSSGSATAAAETTGSACVDRPSDGGYDPCPGDCGPSGQCLSDGESFGVCTRGCFGDCDCWAATTTAPARCSDAVIEGVGVCVLDCAGGQACPAGTSCVEVLGICAHPYSGPMGSSTSAMGSTGDVSSTGTSGDNQSGQHGA